MIKKKIIFNINIQKSDKYYLKNDIDKIDNNSAKPNINNNINNNENSKIEHNINIIEKNKKNNFLKVLTKFNQIINDDNYTLKKIMISNILKIYQFIFGAISLYTFFW